MFNYLFKKIAKFKYIFFKIYVLCFLLFLCFATNVLSANLYFSPSVGTYKEGDIFNVNVLVDSQGVSINSVETNISFPNEFLEVVSVSKVGSIFNMWIQEPVFLNSNQTITFTGGLPTPGYIGTNGKIINITFKAKKAGVAKINYFLTAIRANDGLGSDVFMDSGDGEYVICTKTSEPIIEVPSGTYPSLSPIIYSSSHPDSNKWYSDNNPKFNWDFPNDFNAIRISYDESPDSNPNIFYASKITEKEFINLRDGIYYLHLQIRDKNGWSKVSHFKFQVDKERPLNFQITEINKRDNTKDYAEFSFNPKDELSGLDYFEIQINDLTPEIVRDVSKHTYKTGPLEDGKHVIFIKAYDKSGNYVPSSLMFYIGDVKEQVFSLDNFISYIGGIVNDLYQGISSALIKIINFLNVYLHNPLGISIIKTLSLLGLIIILFLPAVLFLLASSLIDMFLILSRSFGMLFKDFGLKREKRFGGIVYDSVTKLPIDLARVSLIDIDTGRVVERTVTDSYGKYSFEMFSGKYAIEVDKRGYYAPSKNLEGRFSDEVYDSLYFNEIILVTEREDIIKRNIPLDPISFSWNKFVEERNNLNNFVIEKILRKISNIIFVLGFISALLLAIMLPETYHLLLIGLYVLVLITKILFKGEKYGSIVDSRTSIPLSYSIIKIYRKGEENPIIKKVTDKFGKYIIHVPNGFYSITVDYKKDDGNYVEILSTPEIEVKDSLINFDISI